MLPGGGRFVLGLEREEGVDTRKVIHTECYVCGYFVWSPNFFSHRTKGRAFQGRD